MGLFGRKCGHQATSPFRARCTKEPNHRGDHGARGLRWGSNGKVKFGSTRKSSR
jgi:hypothetical protein